MVEDNKFVEFEGIAYHNLTVLTNETAKELYQYLETEFIHHEKFPRLIELVKELRGKFYGR